MNVLVHVLDMNEQDVHVLLVEFCNFWRAPHVRVPSAGSSVCSLGDFVFYSVLVARAAMYFYLTWVVCMVAVLMGVQNSISV